MKVLCDYCGNPIDETLATCPECGAVNKHMLRSGNQVPKTIEELQAFIAEHMKSRRIRSPGSIRGKKQPWPLNLPRRCS